MECGSSALIIVFFSFLLKCFIQSFPPFFGQFSSFPIGIVDIFPAFYTTVEENSGAPVAFKTWWGRNGEVYGGQNLPPLVGIGLRLIQRLKTTYSPLQ